MDFKEEASDMSIPCLLVVEPPDRQLFVGFEYILISVEQCVLVVER